jgi:RNA polymerase sigma factor (sigma-70 family)
VIKVARKRLGPAPQQSVEDAEDAALSAIHGLFSGAAQGRFDQLTDRVDLWQLLVAITVKKALSQRQRHGRQKRGGHQVIRGETGGVIVGDDDQENALALSPSKEPAPESAAIIQEQFQKLLNSLSESTLRQIVLWRMDGLSNAEIAEKMGCVVRTVERKIERIRLIWEAIGETPD